MAVKGCFNGYFVPFGLFMLSSSIDILAVSVRNKWLFIEHGDEALLRRVGQHGQPGRALGVEDIHSHLGGVMSRPQRFVQSIFEA